MAKGHALNAKTDCMDASTLPYNPSMVLVRKHGSSRMRFVSPQEDPRSKYGQYEVQAMSTPPRPEVKRSPLGASQYALVPRLQPVNRICQRWAVSVGNGLPNWAWDLPLKSRPTPLDEETAVVVDTIIQRKIPPTSRKFLKKWYRTDIPIETISSEMIEEYHGRRRPKLRKFLFVSGVVEELKESLQMTENGVILCWNITLDLLRDKFEESRHPELLRLLKVQW